MSFAMLLRYALAASAALFAFGSVTASAAVSEACDADTEARLHVNVQGVRSSDGNVTITVYSDRAEEFLARGTKLVRHRVPAEAGATTDCLALPEPGTYAIAIYHDENGDHDFNRTFIGLPAEGYAFSNDPDTTFSLPAFKEVLFDAPAGDTELTINMKY